MAGLGVLQTVFESGIFMHNSQFTYNGAKTTTTTTNPGVSVVKGQNLADNEKSQRLQ